MRIFLFNKTVFENPVFWKGFSSLSNEIINIQNNNHNCGENTKKRYKQKFGNVMTTVLMSAGDTEPKYDGYQIWIHTDIPDYTDPSKNIINIKYPIKNYLI